MLKHSENTHISSPECLISAACFMYSRHASEHLPMVLTLKIFGFEIMIKNVDKHIAFRSFCTEKTSVLHVYSSLLQIKRMLAL